MQKITPFLWFDTQAEEAVKLYTSLFKKSKKGTVLRYDAAGAQASGMPEGSVMVVDFQLAGQSFTALNGGPIFKFTPAISLSVHCDTMEEIKSLWNQLSREGSVLMGLQEYPFSKQYGWLQDRYGLSWQLILAKNEQKIVPSFLFVGKQHGKAEEAMKFYCSHFKQAKVLQMMRYEKGDPDPAVGKVKYAKFTLERQEFIAMESSLNHPFTFTEAFSFVVHCEMQQEIDHFWERLSKGGDPKSHQCGWLKDKYGVSWQIVPDILLKFLSDKDPKKSQRVMQSMLKMKKIDIAQLEKAYKEEKP